MNDKIENICERWGWLNAKEQTVQETVFYSSTSAFEEMCRRLSLDKEDNGSMDQIYMLGFKLVTVERKITVRRILD